MIKVIIADDHQLIREGLRKVFSKEIDIEITAETDDPFEIMNLVKTKDFDILLLDLNFPNKSGLDILVELKLLYPDIKVLVLTMHSESKYGIRTIKAGAMGYLSKDSDPSEILKAIRRINEGRKYLNPEISELLLSNITGESGNLHEKLSDREYQVLLMLAEGKGQSKIAEVLSISVSTVSTYRSRILEKLNLNSNADIIHYVIDNKLMRQ